ncbi:hypothetical protein NXG27_04215 [Megasphaera paucivorans]|uniref:IrrE N-terminal-like domain-containing protein n=1 Tax=Megasphaera paucivorans TaxID=349095 RepID=A0A1G9QSR5_9FIRM|nr:hypothetical protein [Megasphaera paucivorans]SDM14062.1 hypothetical protein SAMN05660299_00269 [Megasphaera paucivorans]
MNIILIYKAMPLHMKALVHPNVDGTYTIFVNSLIDHNNQVKAVLHEVSHIQCGDFDANAHADVLEHLLHGQEVSKSDLPDIQFFVVA